MDFSVFRDMSYGVYVVSTMDGERPTGCIANSIMQITSNPPTVAISINHDNYTNECIDKNGNFTFSILAEDSDSGLIGRFGFCSGKDVDKFDEVNYEIVQGVPVVKSTCGYVVCKVIDKMETETHTVFLGEVLDGEVYDPTAQAMTYSYYHNVIKGKSPKNAPTYLQEAKEEPVRVSESKVKYVCQVCGYVYEGDPLPEDFRCPVCNMGDDRFTRVEE